jgi:multidrug efflux pump subunit AcrB
MFFAGIPLNMITLAALITVLGMIVDNSVVIVDSYLDKLDHGTSRWHASIESAKEYLKSIFSATLAISITFFPFLITMDGMMYDFLEYFPWTITITLGISLLVAILVIPFLQYVLIRKGLLANKRERKAQGKKERKTILDYLQNGYNKLLATVFKFPKITLLVALASIVVGCALFTILPQRLMPVVERNQFAVEIYLPQGSALEQTAAVSDSMEHILLRDERVKSVTAFVGASSPRFHIVYAPNMPSTAYAQFIVNTHTAKDTEAILAECTDKYASYFPEAYVKFKQLDFQAVDAPIEVRFAGDNMQDLKEQAEKLTDYFNTMNTFRNVRTNYEEMLPGAKVTMNPVEAGRLGINKAFLSMNLSSNYGGMSVGTLWEGDYPLAVSLKSENTNQGFNSIGDVNVSGMLPGVSVLLRQVAEVEPEWTQGKIVRRNGIRTISVFADLKWEVNSKEMLAKVKEYVNNEIAPSLPAEVEIEYGGEEEQDSEVLPTVMSAFTISVFIIFLILVFHFKRIKIALLVFSSSLLTLFGAAFGVWVMGIDFSMTAILGIVSLIGIVVRNGIIMFDYTDELRQKHKMSVREAAFKAGKRRMRPIFLTSAAASMGVIPMIISKDLMWSPLGTVIFFGTLISMIFVVTVLPVAYWLLFKKEDKNQSNNKIHIFN